MIEFGVLAVIGIVVVGAVLVKVIRDMWKGED